MVKDAKQTAEINNEADDDNDEGSIRKFGVNIDQLQSAASAG